MNIPTRRWKRVWRSSQRWTVMLALTACLTQTACRKRKQAVVEEAPPAAPPPSQPASAAPALGLPPVAAPPNSGPRTPQHAELFNAFYKFVNDKGRVPRDVEELVSSQYLAPLPPPPPGKKYLLNKQSLELSLVDR